MASKTGLPNWKSEISSSGSSRSCLCAPTNHPGSFRCSFHRTRSRKVLARPSIPPVSTAYCGLAMAAKASALNAFLLHIIKPSGSGNDLQKKRKNFLPKPSRFCVMNNHGHGLAVS